MINESRESHLRETLRIELENSAEWRLRKAEEYPDDDRNVEAAELLRRLAATVGAVEEPVLDAWGELFEDLPDGEIWNDMKREVGFHRWPDTASELVAAFIARSTGG